MAVAHNLMSWPRTPIYWSLLLFALTIIALSIKQYVQTHEQLIELNMRLESKVAERTKELEQLATRDPSNKLTINLAIQSVMMLLKASVNLLKNIAERFRQSVEQLKFDPINFSITISLGITLHKLKEDNLDTFIVSFHPPSSIALLNHDLSIFPAHDQYCDNHRHAVCSWR